MSGPPSTCEPSPHGRYRRAVGFLAGHAGTTQHEAVRVRTVSTTATTGVLVLRYAPRRVHPAVTPDPD